MPECGTILEGIAFNIDRAQWPNLRIKQAHVGYRLDVNIYQGRSKLQLMVETLNPL